MTEVEEVPSILLPCGVCGRTFRPEALSKHSLVCEKQHAKKRKKFDSAKQRIQGTELAEFLGPPPVASKPRPKPPSPKKAQSRWKEKHEALVRTMRDDHAKPVDHQQCVYCDRFFGPKAFDRHVTWCKEQHCKIQVQVHSEDVSKAKQRLHARTKYRAPSFRSQRSVTKEKYSPQRMAGSVAATMPSPTSRDNLPRIASNTSSTVSEGGVQSGRRGAVGVAGSTRQNSLPRAARRDDPVRKSQDGSVSHTASRTSRAGSLSSQASDTGRSISSTISTHSVGAGDMASSYCLPADTKPPPTIKPSLSTNRELEKYDPFISAELQMMELLKNEEEQKQSDDRGAADKLDYCGNKQTPHSNDKKAQSVVDNNNQNCNNRRSSSGGDRRPSSGSDRRSSNASERRPSNASDGRPSYAIDRRLSSGSDRRPSIGSSRRPSSSETVILQPIDISGERRASICSDKRVSSGRDSKKSSPEPKDSGIERRDVPSPSSPFRSSPSSAFLPVQSKVTTDSNDNDIVDVNSNSQPCKMLSLSTLSLCSEASLEALDPGLKQRCLSAAATVPQPPPRITSSRLSKQRLNMHDLLFGLEPKSSDSLNNNKQSDRRREMDRCEAQLLSSMVEFELLLNRNSDSPSPIQAPNLASDSAYSSLNRRWSPSCDQNAGAGGGVDDGSGSKFCHECGGRYPVPGAKFCCLCGVRRLAI